MFIEVLPLSHEPHDFHERRWVLDPARASGVADRYFHDASDNILVGVRAGVTRIERDVLAHPFGEDPDDVRDLPDARRPGAAVADVVVDVDDHHRSNPWTRHPLAPDHGARLSIRTRRAWIPLRRRVVADDRVDARARGPLRHAGLHADAAVGLGEAGVAVGRL